VSSLQRVSGFSAQLMLEDHDTRTQSDLSHTHTHRFIDFAARWLDWTDAIKKNKTKI